MNEDEQTLLLAEQLRHANSLLKAELAGLRHELEHMRSFNQHRLDDLEKQVSDHEGRLRAATDGVTQFKMWSGLANGGSGILALAALLKAYLF
jgi:hypothetical protein